MLCQMSREISWLLELGVRMHLILMLLLILVAEYIPDIALDLVDSI